MSKEMKQLDIRPVPPREKHPTIFATFDALEKGETFQLVNDHDPAPLHYQFEGIRKDQYTWEYVEEGPEVWRVNISKK